MQRNRSDEPVIELVDTHGALYRGCANLNSDGTITVNGLDVFGLCDAYLVFGDREKYRIGFRQAINGQLKVTSGSELYHEVAIDSLELNRLGIMLKQASGLELFCSLKGKEHKVRLTTESGLEESDYFAITFNEDLKVEVGEQVDFHLEISGLSFLFHAEVVASDLGTAVLNLPLDAKRVFNRTTPRISRTIGAELITSDGSTTPVQLDNVSYFGVSLSSALSLSLWDRVQLALDFDGRKIVVSSIVVRSRNGQYGLLISSQDSTKDLFYSISSLFIPNNAKLIEDVKMASEALKVSGYFDLLHAGHIIDTKADCESGWAKLKDLPEFLQPVVVHEGKPIGTSSSICAYPTAWTGHSFGVVPSTDYLYATKILRKSLRVYQMMRGEPSWYVGQYDDSKGWVGRFYKVFLDEHKNYKGVYSWLRKRYWCKKTKPYNTKLSYIESKDFTEQQKIAVIEFWKSIHGEVVETIPALFPYETQCVGIRRGIDLVVDNEKVVALVHSMSNPDQLNPLSVFNDLSVYAFNGDIRSSSDVMSEITQCCIDKQYKRGVKTTAISYDANFDQELTGIDDFLFFCMSRFITASSIHLPALMSNDALTLEEIYWRHNSGTKK